ncbi:MAG: DUF4239 domain-containing protein [Candidatus Eremiobacteraeota bacterium]|nr:DUF4239 domain-containing protein [Candidatus Eremiobacteraeota bacterium]
MGVLTSFGILSRTIVDVWALVAEMAIVALVVVFFVALHAFIQRRLRSELLRRHNDVAGFLFSAVGVLYAVVLGFVVVVVWQKYDGSVSNVENEVNAVADLYHVVDGYPVALREKIRADLRQYATTVARIEWAALERDQEVPRLGSQLLDNVSYLVDTFSPRNFQEFAAQQAAIGAMQRLFDARRGRLIEAVPAVPSVLWFALIVGALAMVAFCFIFGVDNRPAQLMMTAILVGLIGILFVVIEEFATPFSGSVRISNDGWVYLQDRLPDIR